jgi:hypothetical protein
MERIDLQLNCKQCGAPLRESDLRLDRGIAVCSSCGGVQRLPGPVAPRAPEDSGGPVSRKPPGEVPVPDRFVIEELGNQLTIRYRWFHAALFFLLFFTIAWDSFLVGWYWMLTAGPFGGDPGMPMPFKLVFVIFPLAHVAVGVGLTYSVLAGFLNSTVIRVADGVLSVRHGPVRWPGNLELPTDGIEQIYCRKRTSRSGTVTTDSGNYEVHAVAGGQKKKLLGGLREADHALFLEQQLERFLRIEDRPVPGEMSAMD